MRARSWRSSQPSPERTNGSAANAIGGGAEKFGVHSADTYEARRRRYSTLVNVSFFPGGSMRSRNFCGPMNPTGSSAANVEQGTGPTGSRRTDSNSLKAGVLACQKIWNECGSAMGAVSSSMRRYAAPGGGAGIAYVSRETHQGSAPVTSNA